MNFTSITLATHTRNEIEAAMQDMDTAYHDANDHLGPILRKLL